MRTSKDSVKYVTIPELISVLSAFDVPNVGAILAALHSLMVDRETTNPSDRCDYEDGMTDVEADADTLASVGWGTDEDYNYYGNNDYEY